MSQSQDALKNNMVKMFNTHRDHVYREISRLGSVSQKNTTYRRNGALNFAGRQMIAMSGDFDFHMVGVGGPPVVG